MKSPQRDGNAVGPRLSRRFLLLGGAASLAVLPIAALGQAARPSDAADGLPPIAGFAQHEVTTARHRTVWIEAGPVDGPLMIFLHGWPGTPLVWREQMAEFAAAGHRCVAPFMRGYAPSSVPDEIAAYAVREATADMTELQDALGGAQAVWVGHDWGSSVVWAMASHHPERCRGVVSMTVPYLSRGFALANVVPLVDRNVYPESRYPYGQWDYWVTYRESFGQTAQEYEADIEGVLRAQFQPGTPEDVGTLAFTSDAYARGGLFSGLDFATIPADRVLLPPDDFAHAVASIKAGGFEGPNAWYANDEANQAYAQEAVDFGRLSLPVLFLHGAWETVLVTVTVTGRLAEPMRADCADLTEAVIDAGHHVMLERPDQVNAAVVEWLAAKGLG